MLPCLGCSQKSFTWTNHIKISLILKVPKMHFSRLTVKYSIRIFFFFFFFHPEKKRSTKRGVDIVRCKRPQKILLTDIYTKEKKYLFLNFTAMFFVSR